MTPRVTPGPVLFLSSDRDHLLCSGGKVCRILTGQALRLWVTVSKVIVSDLCLVSDRHITATGAAERTDRGRTEHGARITDADPPPPQSTWATPGFREYHRRMQLFILLYIEAGSYIREDEETWEFVVLYEKRKRRSDPKVGTYHFVGYATLYPFYCFPEKVRMRISQFVILPPYQQEGHGSALYAAVYQHVLGAGHIAELTVEDPAEAFEDLRDRNDLKMLLADERFMHEALGDGWGGAGGGRVGGAGRRAWGGLGAGAWAVNRREGRERDRVEAEAGSNASANGAVVAKGRTKKGKICPPADRVWLEKWRVELKLAAVRACLLFSLRTDAADECFYAAILIFRYSILRAPCCCFCCFCRRCRP
ncbi:hypothetical protein AcW1_005315 [Taiwanofungus camphoratus]|nr:hypothetical protein AcW1_005315 [Antrodia cinnamomea]